MTVEYFLNFYFDIGKLQLANCSGSKRAGDWNLNVTPGMVCKILILPQNGKD